VSRCCSSCYDKIADLLDAEDNVTSSGVRDGSGRHIGKLSIPYVS